MSVRKTKSRISRRSALKLGGAALVTAPFVKRAQADGGKVVVGSWGGPYTDAQAEAYFVPFEAATGIKVEIVTAGNFTAAGMKAAVETSSYEWDWTTLGSNDFATASKNGWLEPIDYTLIDASNKTPDTQFFDFGVGAEATSDIMAYRSDVFPDGSGPQSWADFWDLDAFPGPRSMWKSPWPILEAALLADGVPADQLYPLDLDRAFAKADEIRDAITVWWESGSQSQEVLVSKNVVISQLWNGRAGISKRDGAPIEIVWNQGFFDPAFFCIPKGSPNAENAMRLTDWSASPEAGARFAELTYYGPSNLNAIELIDPAIRPLINSAPENLAQQIHRDYTWWADNLAPINERFVAWMIM